MELPFYDADNLTLEAIFNDDNATSTELEIEDTQGASSLTSIRVNYKRELLMCHLNINSLQNKFEEAADIIKKARVQMIVISKTKIDSPYPDSQFDIPGYSLYRNDRKKGGGCILSLH